MVIPMEIHVVKTNETVFSIARQYGVSPESIIFNNQLYQPTNLAVGQALLILIPQTVHIVRPNESLYSIANLYSVPFMSLVRNNPYLAPTFQVTPGDALVISYGPTPWGNIDVSGFAYPFIGQQLLEETLPYLTHLMIFSYGFHTSGELIPIPDEPLISKARLYGVKPIMVLTPFTNDTFDNRLIHVILNDQTAQRNLIENILFTLREKNYAGVDIDFENVLAQDKEAYVDFIRNLSLVLRPEGFTLSVDLSPKEYADQKGLLYEGLDYAGLGAYADYVLLMTYEWGYAGSEPRAVAPLNKVRQILEYALTVIPPEKINLGIPNYGYRWPLPYVPDVTRATSISNVYAPETAAFHNAEIFFNQPAMTPTFSFTDENGSFEVWYEDVRSIQAKLNLIPLYSINGAGYWNLMRPFRANWLLINALFQIVR